MASAALRVLAIPELLETILQYLPLRELLLNQRVSTAWQATTTKSPTLQQQLHYRDTVCDVDPVHTSIEWSMSYTWTTTDDRTRLPKDWLAPQCHSDGTKEDLVKQSWYGMFVTRPAVSEIQVDFFATQDLAEMMSREGKPSGIVTNPNGVTMGQLKETEWIDKEVQRRCAKGRETRVRLSIYAYGVKSVRPVLVLFPRYSRRSHAIGWFQL